MQYSNPAQPANSNTGALICHPTFKKQQGFNNAIVEAADNAGCQFLFEVPAEFFGFEESRAAAIKLNASHEENQLAFILCDRETGVIHVLSDNEAPSSVIRFVESYANVLSFFQTQRATSH